MMVGETDDDGGSENGGGDVKKGSWTHAEDAVLVEYVDKHGEGNWNSVQKITGLLRCGKSCRLRWTNHLRPDLKKGPFTDEEERLVVKLHAKLGNRWSRMAAYLPGRTDNEIKNFWNTRVKRYLRSDLPLYPPNMMCSDEMEESDSGGADTDSKGCSFDSLHMENYDLPVVKFKDFVPKFTDIAQACTQMKELGLPSSSNFMLPTKHPQEHLTQFTSFTGNTTCSGMQWVPSFGQFQEDSSYGSIAQHPNLGLSLVPDPGSLISPCSSAMALAGTQSLSILNSSASKPTSVAVNTELPSFQYSVTDIDGWARSSRLQPPEFDSTMDTFFQPPPGTDTIEPEYVAPSSSGLLDAVVYEDEALNAGKNGFTSLLNEHIPPINASGSYLDEQLPAEVSTGCNVMPEPCNAWDKDQVQGTTSQVGITRPDALLASDCIELSSEYDDDDQEMLTLAAHFDYDIHPYHYTLDGLGIGFGKSS